MTSSTFLEGKGDQEITFSNGAIYGLKQVKHNKVFWFISIAPDGLIICVKLKQTDNTSILTKSGSGRTSHLSTLPYTIKHVCITRSTCQMENSPRLFGFMTAGGGGSM